MSGSISTFVTRTALRRAAAAMAGLALLGAAAPATLAAGPGLGLLTTVDVSHPIALAADPSLDTVYVGQFGGGLVALSGSTGQSKHAPISLPGPLLSIAVNPATHTVYAADGDTANGSALSIIDGDDLSAAPMNVRVICCPSAVAVNPVTNTVYLLNGGDQLSVLDGTTGRAIHAPISVGIQPGAVAVDPSTNTVYVAESELAELWVIDGATDSLDPTPIEGTGAAGQLAIDPSTHTVYVASGPENTVTAISEATRTKVATIPLGGGTDGAGASGIAVDPSTHEVYVGDSLTKAVTLVQGADPKAAPVTVPLNLPENFLQDNFPVAVDSATHFAYAADFTGNTLSVLVPFPTEAPGAPIGVAATDRGGAATITFNSPVSDGDTPITSYTLKVEDLTHPADGGQTITQSASQVAADGNSITFSPLSLNTEYRFTVAATNAVGTGPAQESNVLELVGNGSVGTGNCSGPIKCQ